MRQCYVTKDRRLKGREARERLGKAKQLEKIQIRGSKATKRGKGGGPKTQKGQCPEVSKSSLR